MTFRYKDYRRDGQARYGTMTLSADEFIRRFLIQGFAKAVSSDPRLRAAGQAVNAGGGDQIMNSGDWGMRPYRSYLPYLVSRRG